jgi:glycosyltransferase involved in cell wall biosynthesis
MKCVSFLTLLPDKYEPANYLAVGANVAERLLIEASLKYCPNISWEFWLPELGRGTGDFPPIHLDPCLDHLIQTHKGRITLTILNERTQLESGPMIGVVSMTAIPQLHELRISHNLHNLRICGIIHSVLTDRFPTPYYAILASLKEGDKIIASSTAGAKAVAATLSQIFERLSSTRTSLPSGFSEPWNIHTIPFGVDSLSLDSSSRGNARRLLQIPDDCFVALYVGRLSQQYKADLDILLTAILKLQKRMGGVRLVLAGQAFDRGYVEHLRRKAVSLGLSLSVIIIENFAEILKASIYAAADVFLMPSDSIQETFGLAVLEAMAFGLPVVAADWSGLRDIVLHGETGFLVPTYLHGDSAAHFLERGAFFGAHDVSYGIARSTVVDCDAFAQSLSDLALNSALCRAMGAKAKERAEQYFSWKHVIGKYLDVWRAQLAHRGGSIQEMESLQSIFKHYASANLHHDLVVVKTLAADGYDEFSDHLRGDARSNRLVSSLLEALQDQPATISELLAEGFFLETVLFTIKKGFCRFIDTDKEDIEKIIAKSEAK